jgi:hypothetical protein
MGAHKTDEDMKAAKKFYKPTEVPRNEKGQPLPGYSLNPGGLPKKAGAVREYAKLKSDRAMAIVYEILNDDLQKSGDRLAAARIILQAAGVMVQKTEVSAPKDELSEISSEDLKKFLAGAEGNKNEPS